MNTLPTHRQILFGRTHGRTWEPGDSDPIVFYPATGVSRLARYLMAASAGAAVAALALYAIARHV